MNGYLFDHLTRGLATGASRRTVLQLVLTGAAGIVASSAFPVAAEAATLCPVRAPNGQPPRTNGCSPAVGSWGAVLRPACDQHDVCYWTCNSNKSACDTQFLQSAYALCSKNATSVQLYACKTSAYNAYLEMKNNTSAYVLAQQAVCVCCSVGQVVCGGRCVSNSCATGQVFNSTTCACQ